MLILWRGMYIILGFGVAAITPNIGVALALLIVIGLFGGWVEIQIKRAYG